MRLRHTTITTVAMLMLVLPASTAVAQDDSPPPGPATTLAESVFADEFPAELGGVPWNYLTVETGAASLGSSSLGAEILEELEATDDDLTVLLAFWSDEDSSEGALGSVIRVTDADAARLLELVIPSVADGLADVTQEAGEVSGKDVTLVYGSEPEARFGVDQPMYFYATGDKVYLISAPEPYLTEFLDALP